MENWYPIDLHIHTVVGITRDKKSDVVNFTYELFQRVINKYKFGLMAVTNHNVIDMTNYILMRYLCRLNHTNLLLGVELDSKMTVGAPIHIVAIFNSHDFQKNYNAMHEINLKTHSKKADQNTKEIIYSDKDIVDLLSEHDVVLIPHGDKDKGIFRDADKSQLEEALKKVSEGFIRIFDSPSHWKMEQIKSHLDNLQESDLDEFGGVLFSDNRDWENYEKKFRNFYMNAEPTFRGLLHSITNPTKRFCKENEIPINSNYISKIVIHKNSDKGRLAECEINLSPYYNCVIGKSGSGKSLLLYLIKKHLSRNEQDDIKYSNFSDYQIEFQNESGKVLKPDLINIGIGENLFDKIIRATTTKDANDLYEIARMLNTSFKPKEKFNEYKKEYINKIELYLKYKGEVDEATKDLQNLLVTFETNISKLLILKDINTFDITSIKDNEFTYHAATIDSFDKYEEEFVKLERLASSYKGKYSNKISEKLRELKKYFRIALLDIHNTYSNENIIRKKIELINIAIQEINSKRSNQAESKSKILVELPKSREKIVGLIKKKYLNKIKMENIDFSFDVSSLNTTTSISNDCSVKVHEYFENDFFENFDIRNNSIFRTHGKKAMLENTIYNLTNRDEARQVIKKYIDVGLITSDNISINEEFCPTVQVLFNDQDVIHLNPGDIAKKYITIYFEERLPENNNSVVLYDQIENDVDKPFINDTIRKLIENTKGKIQTIIVTHDPIVAVNADPNKYIISNKDDANQVISYRDFTIESEYNNEIETISNVVDGSKTAIRRRYEIYKGDNLHD